MIIARTFSIALFLSGLFVSGQTNDINHTLVTIFEGGGLSGLTRRIELNDVGTLLFELKTTKKPKTNHYTTTMPSNESRSTINDLRATLSAIDHHKVNQSKCFDGTTYRFTIRSDNLERHWIFYNIQDLRSISTSLADLVDKISKSAPQPFRIFTTMPQPQNE